MTTYTGEYSDALRELFVKNLSYEDIINSCQSEVFPYCDDLTLWYDKIKFEMDYYDYDLHEFLRQALEMRQYYYLEAALKFESNDINIMNILFKYGFITDNIAIMKQYAKENVGGLYKTYKRINDTDRKWVEEREEYETIDIDKYKSNNYIKIYVIIKRGYFILNDYYDMLSLVLKKNDLNTLYFLSEINLPTRIHPRYIIFNKLILRYIGYHPNQFKRKKELHLFKHLKSLYVLKLSSRKNLYNLIFDTYIIEDINKQICQEIYSTYKDPYFYDRKYGKIWIFDDLSAFIEISTRNNEVLNKHNSDLIYNNGKIIEYIIDKSSEGTYFIIFLANANLNLIQFDKVVGNVNDSFLVFMIYYLKSLIGIKQRSFTLQKLNILIQNEQFVSLNIKILQVFFEIEKVYGIKYDYDIIVFLKQPLVARYMKENNIIYTINYNEQTIIISKL